MQKYWWNIYFSVQHKRMPIMRIERYYALHAELIFSVVDWDMTVSKKKFFIHIFTHQARHFFFITSNKKKSYNNLQERKKSETYYYEKEEDEDMKWILQNKQFNKILQVCAKKKKRKRGDRPSRSYKKKQN